MGWSWYLANDMQFFILSPLMLIPLYYSSILGALSCGFFLLVCLISTGVISYSHNLYVGLAAAGQGGFDDIYRRPWTRVGPYAVGMFAGYILNRSDCKIKMPKIINLLGWTVSTILALSVVYGLYYPTGYAPVSRGVAALYNATSRSAWAIAVCWVIVVCATGQGGWVNTLLSWKAIVPLSRLTYCAYLVHPVVMLTYYLSRRTLLYYTDMEISILFCGFLCFSYGFAFIVSLAYESPMMSLEKVLVGKGKNN